MLERLQLGVQMIRRWTSQEGAIVVGGRHERFRSCLITALFFCVFVFLLKPEVNNSLAFFDLPDIASDRFWNIVLFAVSVVCIALYIVRRHFDPFFLLMAAALVWIALSTAINGGEFKRLWNDWLPLLAVVGLVGAFVRSNWLELTRAMLAACLLYLLLNLAGIFLDGRIGLQAQNYLFFGVRTITFKVAVPAILCAFLLDVAQERRISALSVFTCLLSIFETFVGYCATTLVAILVFIALRIACESRVMRPKLNIFVYATIDIVACLSIVILRAQNAFAWFIEGVLHRSVTLSGRVGIWDTVFTLLGNGHLALGYGASYTWNTIFVDGKVYMHAHNDLLNLLMTGGIVLTVLVTVFFAVAALQLYRCRSSEYAAILAAAVFCFMIIGVFEVTNCIGSFFLLAMSYGVKDFVGGKSVA